MPRSRNLAVLYRIVKKYHEIPVNFTITHSALSIARGKQGMASAVPLNTGSDGRANLSRTRISISTVGEGS